MKVSHLRFHEIDFLRGVACASVVAFHYLSRAPRTHEMDGVDYPFADAIAGYGHMGVPLFFVISGFVILLSANGATPRSFFASRVTRLYPALWVAATLTAGTAWFFNQTQYQISFHDYLINLTMLAHWFNAPFIDGDYWTLGYELHFYIFVWIALRCGLLGKVQWLLVGWLLISAINAVLPSWPAEFWLNARWAPFFVAGGVFYLIRTTGVTYARLGLLAVSFILALLYHATEGKRPVAFDGLPLLPPLPIIAIIAAIFVCFWLVATSRFQMKASPITYYAGLLTYPVYLIHENFGFMVFAQLRQISVNAPVALLMTLFAVLGISLGIHVFTERPLGRFLKRTLTFRQPVAPLA